MSRACRFALSYWTCASLIPSVLLYGCAASPSCSTQLSLKTPPSEWASVARVTREDAEKLARNRLNVGPFGQVIASELRSNAGCLIWSVGLRLQGESGLTNVQIDAGDGNVLMVTHESDLGTDSVPTQF
jgi:hypothetical protein